MNNQFELLFMPQLMSHLNLTLLTGYALVVRAASLQFAFGVSFEQFECLQKGDF